MSERKSVTVTPPRKTLTPEYRRSLAAKVDRANLAVVRAQNAIAEIKPKAADYDTPNDWTAWHNALAEYNAMCARLQRTADELTELAVLIDG